MRRLVCLFDARGRCFFFRPRSHASPVVSPASFVTRAAGCCRVSRRGSQPGADRERRAAVDRFSRPLQHRRSAAGCLYGDLHADGILHRQARGDPAAGGVYRDVNADLKVGSLEETSPSPAKAHWSTPRT